jgi:hypothetical protein
MEYNMGKIFTEINDTHRTFIQQQHLFFVASAPLTAEGHVNLSPKGLDCFRVLSPGLVGYSDMTGSGNETAAHIVENQRITFMFCAFDGPPLILRLYGKGQLVLPGTPEWAEYSPQFPIYTGTRQLILAHIYAVQTSCGFAVPLYDYKADRDVLHKWADNRGPEGLAAYRAEKNQISLDGLPTQ